MSRSRLRTGAGTCVTSYRRVSRCFALPAEALERFQEERLDVVRLQTPGLGTLHVFADAVHATRVHRVVREGALLEQILKLGAVERVARPPA